ncbi:hypothetical protein Tco_0449119 [Tanacetum coccineum]
MIGSMYLHLTHTPAAIDNESKLEEAPSETEEFQPLAARTAPPSSDHTPISSDSTPVSPLIDEEFEASEPSDTRITSSHSTAPSDSTTPLSPTRIAEATALSLSLFCKRYRSSYETPSPSSSLTLPIRKRYQGQQQVVLVVDTATDKPLGLSYEALRRRELRVEETPAPRPLVRATWVDPADDIVYIDIPIYVPPICVPILTPPSPEWSSGSLLVSPSSPAVPTLVALPATTPVATIAVDEDEFLEAGHVDAQRAEMWQARYDDHRLIHDLLVQNTKMQRELQELRDRVTILE